MTRTVYSVLATTELITFAIMRDNRSELEIELAERLNQALEIIDMLGGVPQPVDDEGAQTGLFGHG